MGVRSNVKLSSVGTGVLDGPFPTLTNFKPSHEGKGDRLRWMRGSPFSPHNRLSPPYSVGVDVPDDPSQRKLTLPPSAREVGFALAKLGGSSPTKVCSSTKRTVEDACPYNNVNYPREITRRDLLRHPRTLAKDLGAKRRTQRSRTITVCALPRAPAAPARPPPTRFYANTRTTKNIAKLCSNCEHILNFERISSLKRMVIM